MLTISVSHNYSFIRKYCRFELGFFFCFGVVFGENNFGIGEMDIQKHDLTRKDVYIRTIVKASAADVIFSNELHDTTIQSYWCVIFPIISYIQVSPNPKKKSETIHLI